MFNKQEVPVCTHLNDVRDEVKALACRSANWRA
jgi:hypothetical protein